MKLDKASVTLPAAVEAVKGHQRTMQQADPYSNVSLAEAARDLLRRGLAASERKKARSSAPRGHPRERATASDAATRAFARRSARFENTLAPSVSTRSRSSR